jgi:hypothetical protein
MPRQGAGQQGAATASPRSAGAGAGRDVEVPRVAAVALPTAARPPGWPLATRTMKEHGLNSDAEAYSAGTGGEGRGPTGG